MVKIDKSPQKLILEENYTKVKYKHVTNTREYQNKNK